MVKCPNANSLILSNPISDDNASPWAYLNNAIRNWLETSLRTKYQLHSTVVCIDSNP